jgi:hypothetical protein
VVADDATADDQTSHDPAPDELTADELAARMEADAAIDVERIEVEERIAAQRLSMIAAGRRKGGVLGAAAAGAMIGLRDIYEGPPPQDDIVIEIESSGAPTDIDVDGISATVDDVDYWAPPPRTTSD